MKKRTYIISLVAVLVVGIFIGHLSTRFWIKNRIKHVKHHYEHPAEKFKNELYALGLNDLQKKSVDSLLHIYDPKICALRKGSRDSVKKLHTELHKELELVMTEVQILKWKQNKYRERKRRKHEKK